MTAATRQHSTVARSGTTSRRAAAVAALSVAAVLFFTSFHLFTRANRFPAGYHPDEPGKGLQILQNRRNYRHPQLLLEVATVAARVTGAIVPVPADADPEDAVVVAPVQRVVEVGRDVSAGFAAAAVAIFALVAWRTGGGAAMFVAGVGLALCRPLLVNAHFMKEDAALVFGLAVLAAAGRYAWEKQGAARPVRLWAATLLGVAFTLAGSGKYVGIVAVFPAVWLLFAMAQRPGAPASDLMPGRLRLLVAFFAAATATSFVVNWRVFKNPGTWAAAVGRQALDGVVEHGGLTMSTPNSYALSAFIGSTPPYVIAGTVVAALVGLAALALHRDRWLAVVGFSPVGYLFVVSFGTAPNHRHVLPAVVLAHVSAAVVVGLAVRRALAFRPAMAAAAGLALAVAMAAVEWPTAAALNGEFADDSRARAAEWVRGNLLSADVVLQDATVELHDPMAAVPAKVLTANFAPEFADLDALRAKGVTHVAVCELAYGRYFTPQVVPTAEFRAEYDRRRAWYARLFREGRLDFQARPEVPTHAPVCPEVRIYRLP